MLKLGDKTISKICLGDKVFNKAYLGDKVVFQSIKLVDWTQPTMTGFGVMGGDSFACAQSSSHNNLDFYNVISNTNYWHSSAGMPQWVSWYNPNPLVVTKLTFNSHASGNITKGYVQASNDNKNWKNLTEFNNSVTSGNFEIDLSFNTIGYKYYRLYITGCAYYVNGNYYALIGSKFKITAKEQLRVGGRFVNSIIFDGASCVDTIIGYQTCNIECDIRFGETGTRQLMGFDSNNGRFWGAGATGIFDLVSGTNALDRTNVVLNVNATNKTLTVNADGVTKTSPSGTSSSIVSYKIGALELANGTGLSYWCTCEVWGNKITNANGELIQDLRPYVDDNGVACFKDIVTGALFYNEGTGTLSYTE